MAKREPLYLKPQRMYFRIYDVTAKVNMLLDIDFQGLLWTLGD